MADKRAFANFDVGYLDNPKIMDVFDASPIAVCMHIASVLYCAQHLTDGVITLRPMQRKVGGTDADAELLIEAGLWHLPGHDCSYCPEVAEGKAYVHDYMQHNRTSDGVKGRSAAGRKGAEALWAKKKADANSNAVGDANRMRNAYDEHGEPLSENDEIAMARKKERKNSSSSEIPNGIPRPEVDGLLDLLDACLEQNGFKKPSRTKKNADAARLLLDKDGYKVDQVAWMIRWATSDEFWRTNILSMSKLREKFDQLKAKAGVAPKATQAGFNGEIDVDAVLGRDVWTPGTPPAGMSVAEEIEWKKQQRAARQAERLEEAKRKLGVAA